LLETGHTVFGTDNFNDYNEVSLKYARMFEMGVERTDLEIGGLVTSKKYSQLTCLRADFSNSEAINRFFSFANPDIVCHLAARAGVRYSLENPRAYAETNLMGFFNVLDAASESGVKYFIYAISSSVNGLNEKFPLEESDSVDHPVSLYAATKRSKELMAHAYSHLYNIPTTGLCFFMV
jgi:UDP-glucuronate 4-epimerase